MVSPLQALDPHFLVTPQRPVCRGLRDHRACVGTISKRPVCRGLRDRRVVERGAHGELIRMNGVYKRLGRRQFGLNRAAGWRPQRKRAARQRA